MLLSVGTGQNLSRIRKKRIDWGYAQWAKPLVQLMLDGLVGVADYQCKQLLGHRYRRINYTFPAGKEVGTDEHERRDDLVKIGEELLADELDDVAEWLRERWM